MKPAVSKIPDFAVVEGIYDCADRGCKVCDALSHIPVGANVGESLITVMRRHLSRCAIYCAKVSPPVD